MTCIAAIADRQKGRVWLVGDTCGTRGNSLELVEQGKVWEFDSNYGGWLFGITGTTRLSQILRYEVDFPNVFEDDSPDTVLKTLSRTWIPAVHEAGRKNGALEVKDGASKIPGSAVIAHGGILYILTNDMAITRIAEEFAGIGSGGDFARGVLSMLEKEKSALTPPQRLRTAIQLASKYCAGVGGRIDLLSA